MCSSDLKKPPTIGTNSTPPPTPASTATMPSAKQAKNSASGQIHQTVAAVSTACISRYANPVPRLAANVSLLFPQLPFLERFAAAAKAGFRYVEYQFPYGFGSAAEVAARAKDAGVEVVLHNLPSGDPAKGDRGIACQPARAAEFREVGYGLHNPANMSHVLEHLGLMHHIRARSYPVPRLELRCALGGDLIAGMDMDEVQAMEFILDKMKPTKNNAEFFDMMRRGG